MTKTTDSGVLFPNELSTWPNSQSFDDSLKTPAPPFLSFLDKEMTYEHELMDKNLFMAFLRRHVWGTACERKSAFD